MGVADGNRGGCIVDRGCAMVDIACLGIGNIDTEGGKTSGCVHVEVECAVDILGRTNVAGTSGGGPTVCGPIGGEANMAGTSGGGPIEGEANGGWPIEGWAGTSGDGSNEDEGNESFASGGG